MRTFSEKGSLDFRDWIHGFIMALLSSGLITLQEMLTDGISNVNWHVVLSVAIAGGVGYIIKQLSTGVPTQIEIDPTKTEVIEKPTKT
jgi:hypothetical protein